MTRKIDYMHRLFGVLADKRCEDCTNLRKYYYRGLNLRKCAVYGETHSEASDWRKKYTACGMFNKEWKGRDIIRMKQMGKREVDEEQPIEGQMNLWEADNG